MAGIGLELKKIYSEDNISNIALGAAYSSMVTVGPTLLIVAILLLMYSALGFNYIEISQRELLSTTILYIFIFCGILISPFNTLFSRYIADKIYQRKFDEILPSYYTGLIIVCAIGTLVAIPLMYRLLFIAMIELYYVAMAYVFWMSMIIVFFSTIYLHATKDYKIIFVFYVMGMSLAFLLAFILTGFMSVINAVITGLALGFFIIGFLQFAQVKRWFKSKKTNYLECLKYFWICRELFVSNGLYTLGIYAHIFVFWFSEGSIIVADTFRTHPMYDMAACIAMFSNISTTIIFIVMAETEFHENYQVYMESVIGGTYRQIQKNKRILFRTLAQQLLRLFAIQSMITAIMFLIVVIFLPQLFFASMIIEIYPILSLGYFVLYLMYSLIIYLYYFNDQFGCMILSIIFVGVSFIATLFTRNLDIAFYGFGFGIGALAGFTFGFFRLKFIEKNINKHIFCDDAVVKPVKRAPKRNVVYKKI